MEQSSPGVDGQRGIDPELKGQLVWTAPMGSGDRRETGPQRPDRLLAPQEPGGRRGCCGGNPGTTGRNQRQTDRQ